MNLNLLLLSFALWEILDFLLRYVMNVVTRHSSFHRVVPDGQARVTLAEQGPAYVKSTIHALLVAARGLHHLIVLWDVPVLAKMQVLDGEIAAITYVGYPRAHGESLALIATNIILAGYLASDLLHVILQFPKLGGVDTAIHHAIFLLCAWVAGRHRAMPFVFSWLIIGEASTPFLNLRWALIKSHHGDGALFDFVQKAFVFTFILTRLFIYAVGLAHLFYMYYQVGNQVTVVKWAQAINLALVCGGFILNMIWLRKIYGVVRKSRRRKESKKVNVPPPVSGERSNELKLE